MVYFIFFVYGDFVRYKRYIVWDNFKTMGFNRNAGWCLVGDFNEMMNVVEKSGGSVREELLFYFFRFMVRDCRIKEILSLGDIMLWVGAREIMNNGVKEKVWV